MEKYVSLLRGINVSGQRMIKMEALRAMYEKLGFSHVQTYIQSGNVVFCYTQTPTVGLENKICQQIAQNFGLEVPVLVKTLAELTEVVQNNPFAQTQMADESKLHVTFLSAQPQQIYIDKIHEKQYSPDEFVLTNQTIYLFCPNGYGNTKLTNSFFENKLKLTATTRNWKTVNVLLNMGEQTTNTNS